MPKNALVIIGPGAIGLSVAADGAIDNTIYFFGQVYQKITVKSESPFLNNFFKKTKELTIYSLNTLQEFEKLQDYDDIKVFYCLPPLEPMPDWSLPLSLLGNKPIEIWFIQNGYLRESYLEKYTSLKIYRGLVQFGAQRHKTPTGYSISLNGGTSIVFGALKGDECPNKRGPWENNFIQWEFKNDINIFEIIKYFINLSLIIGSNGQPATNGDILKKYLNEKTLANLASVFQYHLPLVFKEKIYPDELVKAFIDIALKTELNINSMSLAWSKGHCAPILALIAQGKVLLNEGMENLLSNTIFESLL